MKIIELITRLQKLKDIHGDIDVWYDGWFGQVDIEEVEYYEDEKYNIKVVIIL